MADSRTLQVTSRQLDGLVAYLKGHGLTVDPSQPHGECKTGGWDVSWDITPGQITINLIHHPFLAEPIFWSHIENALKPS